MLTYKVLIDTEQPCFGQAVFVREKGENNIYQLEWFKSIVRKGYFKKFPKANSITLIVTKSEILSFFQYIKFIEKAGLE